MFYKDKGALKKDRKMAVVEKERILAVRKREIWGPETMNGFLCS